MSFLTNRTQWILANGELSLPTLIKSGVPQGTVLGPLLFLLIIDTLVDIDPDLLIMSFADDSKLSNKIENIEDANKMQDALEKLDLWQKSNNMEFNVGKFNLIKSGKNTELMKDYNYLAPGNTELILENSAVHDLGVQISPNMDFNEQISKVYSKTSQRAGLLLRTFNDRSLGHMKFLWKTY